MQNNNNHNNNNNNPNHPNPLSDMELLDEVIAYLYSTYSVHITFVNYIEYDEDYEDDNMINRPVLKLSFLNIDFFIELSLDDIYELYIEEYDLAATLEEITNTINDICLENLIYKNYI